MTKVTFAVDYQAYKAGSTYNIDYQDARALYLEGKARPADQKPVKADTKKEADRG